MGDFQWGWRYCSKCATMFWADHMNSGVCAAGSGGHDPHGFLFVLPYDWPANSARVNGFFYCNKCHSLFREKDFHPDFGSSSTLGACPKGDKHDPTSSFEYVLNTDRPQANGQGKWMVCTSCNCLCYGPDIGKCAGEGDGVIGHTPGHDIQFFKVQFSDDDSDWAE